ncbi:unnamed protein product [Didymodactylos carnosus]|uniref:Uncharacterized protein n=1 Tax=Didymodactylos carnosus TaxID=1234261 RepID=A0A8S2DW18_9BILA|nr:unnamed protein product [Didymodactylos carnosus]CAF3833150.1 unnamed protein product [Didymodactylos carnosus]
MLNEPVTDLRCCRTDCADRVFILYILLKDDAIHHEYIGIKFLQSITASSSRFPLAAVSQRSLLSTQSPLNAQQQQPQQQSSSTSSSTTIDFILSSVDQLETVNRPSAQATTDSLPPTTVDQEELNSGATDSNTVSQDDSTSSVNDRREVRINYNVSDEKMLEIKNKVDMMPTLVREALLSYFLKITNGVTNNTILVEHLPDINNRPTQSSISFVSQHPRAATTTEIVPPVPFSSTMLPSSASMQERRQRTASQTTQTGDGKPNPPSQSSTIHKSGHYQLVISADISPKTNHTNDGDYHQHRAEYKM